MWLSTMMSVGLIGSLVERCPALASSSAEVIGVADVCDVPAVAHEARCHVFAEREAGVAFDGDVIVVVDPAEIGELEVAGERSGFAGNSFHHVAIAADGVDVVIEQLEPGLVEV